MSQETEMKWRHGCLLLMALFGLSIIAIVCSFMGLALFSRVGEFFLNLIGL